MTLGAAIGIGGVTAALPVPALLCALALPPEHRGLKATAAGEH